MKAKISKFEQDVIEHLTQNKTGDLYILSDFYFMCCESLGLDYSKNYKQNTAKIRRKLTQMKKNDLIDVRRCGMGFLGKTDFGCTSMNSYVLKGFFD